MRFFRYDLSPARCGLIVKTACGGLGEAAPLPGWSKETLADAERALLGGASTPSAEFALRSARIPFPGAAPPISVSALASTLDEAHRAIDAGFATVKFKIKHLSPDEALAHIRDLQSRDVNLRIDANRKFSLDEAIRFFERLPPDRIDYIEEPLQEPRLLGRLPPHSVALDETLLEPGCEALIATPSVKALVLKPTLLGNRLDLFLPMTHKTLVFSSSFESAIGLIHLALLQQKIDPRIAAGIDTFRRFPGNFFPLSVKEGVLCSDPLPPMDDSWLKPV